MSGRATKVAGQVAEEGSPGVTTGVFIALGSNLGDRAVTLHNAIREIDRIDGVRVMRRSSLHESEPVGGPAGQGMYLNAVIEVSTTLAPRALLRRLQKIEADHGRTRSIPNGPRTLDLDLLLFGDLRMSTRELTIPHPRMWSRDFVLGPLSEIADAAALRQRLQEQD